MATAAVRTFAGEAAALGPTQAIGNRLTEDRALPGFGQVLALADKACNVKR